MEAFGFWRLLVRSVILSFCLPVYGAGDRFFQVKAGQIIGGLVVCLVLYALERAAGFILRPAIPEGFSIAPSRRAGWRGAALLFVLSLANKYGDIAEAVGIAFGGGLIAFGIFKLEEKLLGKRGREWKTKVEGGSD